MTNKIADTKTPENTTPDMIQVSRRELEVLMEALNDLSVEVANSEKMTARTKLAYQIRVMRIAQYWAKKLE